MALPGPGRHPEIAVLRSVRGLAAVPQKARPARCPSLIIVRWSPDRCVT